MEDDTHKWGGMKKNEIYLYIYIYIYNLWQNIYQF